MGEFVPPARVFQTPPGSAKERLEQAGYDIPNLVGLTRTKTGGMASVFQGHPYPRKGVVYSEAVKANNKVKRLTLSLFQPFASLFHGPKALLESYLRNYIRLAESLYADCDRIPLLKYEYYSELSKAVWHFTHVFLRCLGISFDTAYRTGHMLATIFEYDDAYRYPLQDLFTTSSKEQFKTPSKEVLRLIAIYKQRCTNYNGEGTGAGDRLEQMAKLLSLFLYLPPVKRAFRIALSETNFSWLQFDDLDTYWAVSKTDYNYFGLDFKKRQDKLLDITMEHTKQQNPGKSVGRVEDPDGTVRIVLYD